ncbi:MAG TPA: hypothetical protein DHU26_09530, partial [Spirochaetaceae bacterium]|nr:hypothetical protein [Spirochaetaceae bacterium]
YERLIGFAGGILLIYPGLTTDLMGLALVAVMAISQIVRARAARALKAR